MHRVSRTGSSLATSSRLRTSSRSTGSAAGTRCTASTPSTRSSPGGPSSDLLATGLPGSAGPTRVGRAHIPGAESPAAPGGTQPGLSWPTPGELDAAARDIAYAARMRSGRADETAGVRREGGPAPPLCLEKLQLLGPHPHRACEPAVDSFAGPRKRS